MSSSTKASSRPRGAGTARPVFKGKLLSVFVRTHRYPGGYTGSLEVVQHPGAALIVPFLNRDTVLMLRQYRPVVKEYLWELPAGTLAANESPRACACRELCEETGYRAAAMRRVGSIVPVPGYSTERIHIYAAHTLTAAAAHQEADEVLRVHALSLARIRALVRKGRVIDAKTLSALALCGLL